MRERINLAEMARCYRRYGARSDGLSSVTRDALALTGAPALKKSADAKPSGGEERSPRKRRRGRCPVVLT